MAEKRYTAIFDAKDRVSPAMDKIAKSTDRARDAKGRFLKATEQADRAQDRMTRSTKQQATAIDRMSHSAQRAERHIRSLGDKGVSATRGLLGNIGRLTGMLTSLPSLIAGAGAAFGAWKLGDAVLGGALQQEMAQTQLRGLSGSADVGDSIYAMLKNEAQNSTFSTSDYTQATRSYLGFSKDQEQLKEMLGVTKKLALLDPVQGFEGASFALKEAMSGDIMSLSERFELPKSFLRDNGFDSSGDYLTNLGAVQKTLEQMGMTDDAVGVYESTGMAQITEFRNKSKDFLGQMGMDAVEAMKPFFERVNGFFGSPNANNFVNTMTDKVGGLFKSLADGASTIAWSDIESGLTSSGRLLREIGETGLMFMDAMSGGKGGSPVEVMNNFTESIGTMADKVGTFNQELRDTFTWMEESGFNKTMNGVTDFLGGNPSENGQRKGLFGWAYDGLTEGDWSTRRSVDGSHRAGLGHVPYDGYTAELHQGERVLNASENRQYNSRPTDISIQIAQIHVRSEQDIHAVGQEIVRQLQLRM